MTRQLLSVLLAALFCWGPLPVQAQTPEYSDKDKKTMAEIAQRPEVQQAIGGAWEQMRRQDMEFAYNVNTSSRMGELLGPQWADYRAKYGQVYDNPMLQQYVNNLGHQLVPKDSPNLYAFRLLLDPVPRAEAVSTGTIYVSTGLVSLLDNEAQLAYIVAHEIAHLERNHFYTRLRNEILEQKLAEEKQIQAQKRRTLFSAIGAAAGAVAGGVAGGGNWALLGGMAGLAAGYTTGAILFRNKFEPTEWSTVFENEADEAGLRFMLEERFDAREVPRLYARLDGLVARDARLGLGFVGSPARVRERTAHIQSLLGGALRPEIDRRMQEAGGLTGSSPDFSLLMSALKRDNGIIALDYDLFAMAKDNLEEAARLRSNDPRVHYYLGRLVGLTARVPEERQQALAHFLRAMEYDGARSAYPEPHLEHALYLIGENNPSLQGEIQNELKTYVALYQRAHGGAVPPNMYIIYDYFTLAGDTSWFMPPASVVSTQNVGALAVAPVTPVAFPVENKVQPAAQQPPKQD